MNWHVNGVGMTMLKIPNGRFVRRASSAGNKSIEQTVTLTRSFLLSDSEVTRGQFQQFIDDPDCPDAEKPKDRKVRQSRKDGAKKTPLGVSKQHPAGEVSWYDAVLFCNWLSRKEGLATCYMRTGKTDSKGHDTWRLISDANGYRLPTEAEWEYASRAGTVTLLSHGNDASTLEHYAVFSNRTDARGSRLPNGWGLFDVHGNVWEWCNDLYGPYDTEAKVRDPLGPAKRLSGNSRVARRVIRTIRDERAVAVGQKQLSPRTSVSENMVFVWRGLIPELPGWQRPLWLPLQGTELQ